MSQTGTIGDYLAARVNVISITYFCFGFSSQVITAHKSSEARADPQGGALVAAFDKMDAVVKEKMIKLFNITYFIAKEAASFTMFPKLIALHQKMAQILILLPRGASAILETSQVLFSHV